MQHHRHSRALLQAANACHPNQAWVPPPRLPPDLDGRDRYERLSAAVAALPDDDRVGTRWRGALRSITGRRVDHRWAMRLLRDLEDQDQDQVHEGYCHHRTGWWWSPTAAMGLAAIALLCACAAVCINTKDPA